MKKRCQIEILRTFSEPQRGVEPMTFQVPVGRSNHWAMGDQVKFKATNLCLILLINRKYARLSENSKAFKFSFAFTMACNFHRSRCKTKSKSQLLCCLKKQVSLVCFRELDSFGARHETSFVKRKQHFSFRLAIVLRSPETPSIFTCHVCGGLVGEAHMCIKSERPIHVICGKPQGEKGYRQKVT